MPTPGPSPARAHQSRPTRMRRRRFRVGNRAIRASESAVRVRRPSPAAAGPDSWGRAPAGRLGPGRAAHSPPPTLTADRTTGSHRATMGGGCRSRCESGPVGRPSQQPEQDAHQENDVRQAARAGEAGRPYWRHISLSLIISPARAGPSHPAQPGEGVRQSGSLLFSFSLSPSPSLSQAVWPGRHSAATNTTHLDKVLSTPTCFGCLSPGPAGSVKVVTVVKMVK